MILIAILKLIFKGPKSKKFFSGVLDLTIGIREFFTGFVIFDILTGAMYEISTSKAYEKKNSPAALGSLFLSHVIVFFYIMEIAFMWFEASKLKSRLIVVPKRVKYIIYN